MGINIFNAISILNELWRFFMTFPEEKQRIHFYPEVSFPTSLVPPPDCSPFNRLQPNLLITK